MPETKVYNYFYDLHYEATFFAKLEEFVFTNDPL